MNSEWHPCLWCGKPAIPADIESPGWQDVGLPVLCERCVEIAFVRMTLVRHGLALTDGSPKSSRDTGHARRMAQHCTRVEAAMGTGECEGGEA